MSDQFWLRTLKGLFQGHTSSDSILVDDTTLTLTPEDFEMLRRRNLDMIHTVSGSYDGSILKQKWGDTKFYVLENGQLKAVDTSGITIIKRAYNDGTVGLIFYDNRTNRIVNPDIDFDSNITPSTYQAGEYIIRPAGSNNDPIFQDLSIEGAVNIIANSSTVKHPTPEPPDTPEDSHQVKSYTTDQLNKLVFRLQVGTASRFYTGEVRVRQIRLSDGSYFLNFYDTEGNELSAQNNRAGEDALQIQDLYESLEVDGRIQYGVHISAGGGTGYDFLESTYQGDPEPEPEPPGLDSYTYTTTTNNYKLFFRDSNGNRYEGDVDILYEFEGGRWKFTAVKKGTADFLTITGDNINPIETDGDHQSYSLEYADGVSFIDDFNELYSGDPPFIPPAIPDKRDHKIIIRDPKTSGWQFLRIENLDGTPYTGGYTIEYIQKMGDGEASDVVFYNIDEAGNKIYYKVNFGDMDGVGGEPIFDSNGNDIGRKYSIQDHSVNMKTK